MSPGPHVLYVGADARDGGEAVEQAPAAAVTTARKPAEVEAALASGGVDAVVVEPESASGELLGAVGGTATPLFVLSEDDDLRTLLERVPPGSTPTEDGSERPARTAPEAGGAADLADLADLLDRDGPLRDHPLARVLDRLPDVLYVVDTADDLVYWNETLTDLTGHDEAALARMAPHDLVPETDRQKVVTAVEVALDSEGVQTVEAELLTATGETIPCEFNARRLLDRSGSVVGLVGTAREIGARRERERLFHSLHESTRRLQDVEDRGTVAAHVVTTARDLLDLSATVCWLRSEGEDRSLAPVVGTDEAPPGVQPTVVPGSRAWEVYAAGESAFVESTDCPVAGADRAILYPLGEYGLLGAGVPEGAALEDHVVNAGRLLAAHANAALERVSNLERLRQRERELERQNERLEEFASVVSHDLRSPLSVASGNLELARRTGEAEYFEGVERALARIGTLVDDLLALAREGERASEVEPVSLQAVAEAAWATAETVDASLVVEGDTTVLADRSRLRQVFENLFRNSVEHGSTNPVSRGEATDSDSGLADGGSDVTVTVRPTPEGFHVGDDGPGIPEEEREVVLDPGYSTTAEGTGFGLAIVREIAEAHGWEVVVGESEDGGVAFEFRGVERADSPE